MSHEDVIAIAGLLMGAIFAALLIERQLIGITKKLAALQATFDGLKRTNEEYIAKQFPAIPDEVMYGGEEDEKERAAFDLLFSPDDLPDHDKDWPQVEELKQRAARRL